MRMEELRPRVVEGRRKDDSIRKATRRKELLVRDGPGTISQAARLTRKGDVLGEEQAEVRGTAEAATAPAGDQPARSTSA